MDVVVVGSGMSGLAAARLLADNWSPTEEPLHLVVLEAGDRIGGRIYTGDVDESNWNPMVGSELDFGTMWMKDTGPSQPVEAMVNTLYYDRFNATMDSSKIFLCADGVTDGCAALQEDGRQSFESLVANAQALVQKSTQDMSLWHAMKDLTDGGGRDDPLMRFYLTNSLEYNTGNSAENLSAKYTSTVGLMANESYLKNGFGKVTLALSTGEVKLVMNCKEDDLTKPPASIAKVPTNVQVPIKILLNQEVTDIQQIGTDDLTVVTRGYPEAGNSGSSYHADHVIVTVPLGVLKRGGIKFTPPLPDEKLQAIQRLNFGNIVKVGLLFDQVFWDKDTQHFGLVHSGQNDSLVFSYMFNAFAVTDRPVLITFATGSSANEVENWSDDEVNAQIKKNLLAMFGSQAVNSAKQIGMWRTSWGKDKLFGGGFSAAAPGSTPQDFDAIAKNMINGRLHFAGEHTYAKSPGTVQGAYLAGQAAACEVLANPVPRPQAKHDSDSDDTAGAALLHLSRKWGKQPRSQHLELDVSW